MDVVFTTGWERKWKGGRIGKLGTDTGDGFLQRREGGKRKVLIDI